MIKPYFTRKNLIKLSLAFFYSFVLLFTGLCLEGTHTYISKKNPIALVAKSLNFKTINPGTSGFACLILVAIYISVFVGIFLYERQYAIVNNKKTYSIKMLFTYLLSFIVCVILSLGVGIIIQSPLSSENIGNILTFIWQSIMMTTCIYAVLFAFIGGILMFIVNYILVDKPFRGLEPQEIPEFDDDLINDVTANFDATDTTITGTANAQGVVTSNTAQGVVRQTEKLDDRSKVFPALYTIDEEYNGYEIEQVETDDISLEELCEKFRNFLAKSEKLYFDLDVIRYFVSGFGTTHFTILEGLSGTGKSSLPRYFAKFINANCLFVPVQATWRDKTNLIGYFSDFSKSYSETDFLTTLYSANYNPDRIYFFVLDEMNISRVEYYFADFLSVLEYPEEEWKIRVMQLPYEFIPPVKLNQGIIQIPNNSFFVGTANKDDSTFTITDKVYDRAITIDFDDRNQPFKVNGDVATINLSNSKLQSLYKEAKENEAYQLSSKDMMQFETITNFIKEQFDITFGNRILTQIEDIVPIYVACGGKKEEALDFILSRKVISKIEGRFEDYVKNALKDLLTLINKTYGEHTLKRCEQTINSILRRL